MEDRHAIQLITEDVLANTQEWLSHLRDELEPSLLALNRQIAQGDQQSTSMYKAYLRFRDAFSRSHELREHLKQRLDALLKHEKKNEGPFILARQPLSSLARQ